MTTLKTTKDTFWQTFFGLLGNVLDVAAFIASVVFSGYVLSILWGWLIVPTFFVPILNIPSAIGVMMVAGYVTKQLSYAQWVDGKKEEALKWERWMRWVKPAFALLLGWAVTLFM